MKRFIETHKPEQHYDVIVIGGGITGAAVMHALTAQGKKVALVEKNDFGGATSAATSKLIHGGLRYLKNMELSLVRESLRERRILANIAPNLVYPLPFMVPLYTQKDVLLLRNGMFLYHLLSYDKTWVNDKQKALPKHRIISNEESVEAEGNMRTDGLIRSVVYYDYQNFSPERMTLAFLQTGTARGGVVSNYTRVERFLQNNKHVEGVVVRDLFSGEEKELFAKLTINCAGTWADEVLAQANQVEIHQMKRSEGIHIICKNLTTKHAVTFSTSEGKHFMLMPWRGHTLIGTTDKIFNDKPDNYRVSKESIDEILEQVNKHFGSGNLTYKDILHAYGGLRPLIDDGNDSYNSSRKYEIFDHAKEGNHGLITVEGGKYTTSRNLAHNVAKMAATKLNCRFRKSNTNKMPLAGCNVHNIEQYIVEKQADFPNIQPDSIAIICRNFGTNAPSVLRLAQKNEDLQMRLTHDGELLAEVPYVIENEAAYTLKDILLRRTGIGTLGQPTDTALQAIAMVAASCLQWSKERKQQEIESIYKHYALPFLANEEQK